MRQMFASLLAVALIAGGAMWVRAADAAASDKKTIEGELLDMHCYAKGEKHGEGHAGCAKKCLSADDGKAGVLSDGKAITIDTASKPLADYAAKTVRVTGAVNEEAKTIKPDKIEVKEGDDWKEVSLKSGE